MQLRILAAQQRLVVGAQRLGIHLVLGGAGKFDHRAIARKAVAIGLGVGHRGIGNLRRRTVARRARGIDGVRLGLKRKAAPRHQRIPLSRWYVLEVGGDIEGYALQADALRAFLGRVEYAISRNLRGNVLVIRAEPEQKVYLQRLRKIFFQLGAFAHPIRFFRIEWISLTHFSIILYYNKHGTGYGSQPYSIPTRT